MKVKIKKDEEQETTVEEILETNKGIDFKVESVFVSHDLAKTIEEAVQLVERKGFDGRNGDAVAGGFRFRQLSRDKFVESSIKPFELSHGLSVMMGTLDENADPTFDGMKDRADLGEGEDTQTEASALEPLSDAQSKTLGGLKEEFQGMLGDLKGRVSKFIPTLNLFIDMTENLLKANPFNDFLIEFTDGFQVLVDDLAKLEIPEVQTKSFSDSFESQVLSMIPVIKKAREVFEDSEGFANFGDTLAYAEEGLEKLMVSLPLYSVETEKSKKQKSLIDWRTKDALMGTLQSHLMELASVYKVERKFVTVEYPEKRILDYLTNNLQVIHAAYSDFGSGDQAGYVSLAVKGETLDAFLIQDQRGNPSLVIYFDNEEEMKKIVQPPEDYLNYKFGTYMLKQTMSGYVLVKQTNDNVVDPIFDDNILQKLHTDTNKFFEKRQFFKESGLPHRRGILLYGPPGNGKTTFIKSYAHKLENMYSVMIDCSSYFGPSALDFLSKALGDKQKVLIFEDMDSLLVDHYMRSAILNSIDGVGTNMDNTLIVGTTNNIHYFDKAFLRPSRFDRLYKIDLPNVEMRKKFLTKYFGYLKDPLLTKYAEATEGFSGAYFKELFTMKNIQDLSINDSIGALKIQLNFFEDLYKETGINKDMGGIVWYDKEHDDQNDVRIVKQSEEEEFTVFGEVLIPEETDAHGDIYTAKDVRDAAWTFMENFGNIGLMHRFFINGDVKILETFIAPDDLKFKSMDGKTRKVTEGTWLMKVKILNKALWDRIKVGELTGFSIGGLATVQQLKKFKAEA